MWCGTGGTGMICQSFDTTRHYREEHKMIIEKRDRALLVKLFYLKGSKSSATLKEYRRMKGLWRGPMSANGLKMMMMMKFENTGDFSVVPERGRQSIPMEVVDEVALAVADHAEHAPNSATSARVMSHELSVPWSKVRKILCYMLHWYPYKIPIVQQLKPHDSQQHLDFALRFLAWMEVDAMWSKNILWTDKSHFTLEGAVNTLYCRIWGSTKPLVVHQWPLCSVYVTVWWGFTSTFILGPLFFERITPRGPVRCTMMSASYKNTLCSMWFLPCKNVTVLRLLFLCRMWHHRISVAKFNVSFVKPSQMNA